MMHLSQNDITTLVILWAFAVIALQRPSSRRRS